MAISFSDEQKRVIEERNRNILVSAAAGSGKTAVLVERIIRRILSEEAPVDIDRLLVVTFTNAAAASMRQKIRDALEERYEEDPENENVLRQRNLINMAHITTIHSFCLSVIRDNFNRIELEPTFRIGDEGELALMKEDGLEAVMERAYEESSPEFMDFLSAYSLKRDDSDIKDTVLALYEFSRGKPDSREWLENLPESYKMGEDGLKSLDIYEDILEAVRSGLRLCIDFLNTGMELCERPAGPYFYAPVFEKEKSEFEEMLKLKDFEALGEALNTMTFTALSAKKDESVAPELREEAKTCRNAMKKEVEKLRTRFFLHSARQEEENFRRAYAAVKQFSELTLRFEEEFSGLKKEKNILDFSDIEHYALRIMRSGAAEEYRGYFEEIMTDEYQDSNSVQEEILTSIARDDNYFCVGDVKQSIYRFRLAEPSIFMDRYDRYANEEKSVRIDLKRNYRSRREVLDSVNLVFAPVMSRRLGGVDYDDSQRLNTGAVYEENGAANTTELYYIENDPENELSRAETEAYWVAGRIKELVGSYMVSDDGALRECGYGDIAILMRALSDRAEVFEKILEDQGIPVFTASSSGYFQNDVIRKIIDFISVIDNPRQDIPLAAVLISPFGGFNEAELARIRAAKPDGMLIDALKEMGQAGEDGKLLENQPDRSLGDQRLIEKCAEMLCKLKGYRELSAYVPIHDLIDRIIRDSDYEAYAAAKGGSSSANLKLLLKKAADFEATSYHGLFHFVRYIEKLKKYETETSYASSSEGGECIQLMSIHKSKGLEFPVVFVTGCEKKFNMQDTRGTLIIDSKLGAGVDSIDPERHLKAPTLIKNLIADKLIEESKGEEMRVLYVAMTRAREKLILSGVFDDPGQAKNKNIVSPILADSYFDYIKYSLNKAGSGKESGLIEEKEALFEDTVRITAGNAAQRQMEINELSLEKEPQGDEKAAGFFKDKITFSDDHELINSIPMKAAVTKLKEHFNEEGETGGRILTKEEEERDGVDAVRRKSASRSEGSAARRGTAYHKALEKVDITKIKRPEDASEYLKTLVEKGFLTAEDAGSVNYKDIYAFAVTGLAQRMDDARQRKQLFREQPFIFLSPADEVDKSFPREEEVLIQGIIDAYFIEDGEIVIVDYKTDRVKDAQILKDRYTQQLELYSKALEQITGMSVRQRLIYSVSLNEEIEV
ncbi:MAG: helicase-exonuclease AddAB subunit AddA [Lachnospiraceae bacterium]|nr:helicase-exonuclease AddAB subunit AddA [Lachnospiraceae bacterium]